MALELVTGYQGKDHVTAEQWADFNRGIFGDAAILPIGNRMETAIQTANQITVKDGVAVFDGRQVYIGYGESENIIIESGTQGMLRRDIVVLEYNREESTGIERVEFKVITGTPASTDAKDPSVQNTDIRTGVFVSQKPFCRIRLNGTAIEGVDALVQVKELKPHAFASPVNNLAGTDPELALSGPMGAELYRLFNELNGKTNDILTTSIKNDIVDFTVFNIGNVKFVNISGFPKRRLTANEKVYIGDIPLNLCPVKTIWNVANFALIDIVMIVEFDVNGGAFLTPSKDVETSTGININITYL